jgi:rubredoxin
MPLVVAYKDLNPEQFRRKRSGGNVLFFRATKEAPDSPSAYLNQYDPDRWSKAHYHTRDQFQIIVQGKGQFGRHDVEPYCVHFSRAYTPYGPLHSDVKEGWTFLVLRAHYDQGHNDLPEMSEALKQVPDRRPWQVSRQVAFPPLKQTPSVLDITDIKDDQGLFTKTLTMPPLVRMMTPSPAGGDGLFLVVVKGSLLRDHREYRAMTVVHLKADEPAFEMLSGGNGLQAIVCNLPKVAPRAAAAITPSASPQYRKWQCLLCAFAYDEAQGLPDDGIAPGTRWKDVPVTWTCPDCSASKSDFELIEV